MDVGAQALEAKATESKRALTAQQKNLFIFA